MKSKDEKVRIYQLYFLPEQVQHLNPLFTPYDNTANLEPNQREYPLIRECFNLVKSTDIDLWGTVPWNYKFKFSSGAMIPDEYFLDHIHNNPVYDVYFFNPFTNHVPIVYNVWEQGQWCHPHMITIMEHIFPIMGIDVSILYQPQCNRSIFWGSMCVANNNFWQGYFEFVEKYIAAVDKLPDNIKALHDHSAAYRTTGINYFSFIQERLMSTYVSLNLDKFKVLPFHINEHSLSDELVTLNNLKKQAIINNDHALITQWTEQRISQKCSVYQNDDIDWAKIWNKRFGNSAYEFAPIAHQINNKIGYSNNGLTKYLRNNIESGSSLLDLGCGPRFYSNPLLDKCKEVLCIDAWQEVNPDIVADLENVNLLDIVDHKYDYILMIDFIEHLDKEAGLRLLEQAKQVVNKKIFLLTPLPSIWTSNHENVENENLWCHNNEYDLHKSSWTHADFVGWQEIKLPNLQQFYVGCYQT
jgi:hypothetical protein